MATNPSDDAFAALVPVYGAGLTLDEMLYSHYAAEGSAPGQDAYDWYRLRGAAGDSVSDLRADYWRAGLQREAVLWLDAAHSTAGEPRAINQGSGGSALNAKYGSVLGAYVFQGAAVLPGIASNSLSVPDAAALDITGDIDLIAHVALSDWTPATAQYLINKNQFGTARSYYFYVDTTGALTLISSPDGTSAAMRTDSSTATTGIADGAAKWVRVTRASASGEVKFYLSDDGSTWTQLGATVPGTAGAIFAGTQVLEIGVGQGVNPLAGSVYRAIVRNGIAGTTVLDVDLANVANYATSFTATTGQTVTVNSTSADSNDPLLLTHTGENYVWLGDSLSNSLSVPDAAALDITGDLEVVVDLAANDWTPSTVFDIANRGVADPNRAWFLRINTSGTVNFRWYPTGSIASQISVNSTVAVPFTDTQRGQIKVTIDVDNGAVGNDVKFWTATDGVTWTQLGTTVTTAGVTSLPNVTYGVYLHPNLGGGVMNAKVYRCIVRNGIGGTTVLDINCTTDITSSAATSFVCTSGQTVTVTRATSGRKTCLVTRPVWLFGTDDYMEVADNALLDFDAAADFTVVWVGRQWNTPPSGGRMVSKGNSGTITGYHIGSNSTTLTPLVAAGDGVTQRGLNPPAVTQGALSVIAGVTDRTGVTLTAFTNTASVSGSMAVIGSLANAYALRVGSRGDAAGTYQDMETVAVAVFRRALTAAEIATICTYYGTI